jgi:Leucine-rich repeat (LRR) protein
MKLAIKSIEAKGFRWNKANAGVMVVSAKDPVNGTSLMTLDSVASAFRTLRPRLLDLSGCTNLQNVDCLKSLKELKSLNLNNCTELDNVDGLVGLSALQKLILSHCPRLENVNSLGGMTVLQTLNLSHCVALRDINQLKNLTRLQKLDLSYCLILQKLDGLKDLTNLQQLDFSGCQTLRKEECAQIEAALPTASITLPDGSIREAVFSTMNLRDLRKHMSFKSTSSKGEP